MSATLRPVLTTLPAYVPGRTVPGTIKLASNETPHPPLPYVVERISAVAAGANRYPDGNATEERGVIVRAFAGSGARVTIGMPDENDRFLVAAEQLSTG